MTNFFFSLATQVVSQATDSQPLDVLALVQQAGWVVKGVMALLIAASIVSWTIIFWKLMALKHTWSLNRKFAEAFWAAGSLDAATRSSRSHSKAPLAHVFESALLEFNQVNGLKLSRDEKNELLETNVARSLEKASRWDPLESTCRHASLSIL